MTTNPMQLDIFDHSRDVMLKNDVIDALQRRDATAARSPLATLRQEYPNSASLPDLNLRPCGCWVPAPGGYGFARK